jgi:hypothetical protein
MPASSAEHGGKSAAEAVLARDSDAWKAAGYPRPMDYDTNNVLHKALHSWITPLLRRGRTSAFAVGDALPLLSPQDDISALVGRLAQRYSLNDELDASAKGGSRRNGIWWALLAAHAPEMLLHTFWLLFEMCFRLSTPFALLKFVKWLREWDEDDPGASESQGWMWAALVCVLSTGLAMSHHQLFWVGMRMGYGMKQQVRLDHMAILVSGAYGARLDASTYQPGPWAPSPALGRTRTPVSLLAGRQAHHKASHLSLPSLIILIYRSGRCPLSAVRPARRLRPA